MTALAILEETDRWGLRLSIRGDKLHVEPEPPAELIEKLRANKPEIMAELRRQSFAVFENGNATEYASERTGICAADGLGPSMLRHVFTCTLKGHLPFVLLGRPGETLETTAEGLRVQFGDDFVALEFHNVRPPT